MSIYNKAGFEAVYAAVLGTFADNTTRNISEGDLRQFAQDISDSLNFGGSLNWFTMDIGDWDMDTNATVTVDVEAEGVDISKVRVIHVTVRPDVGTLLTENARLAAPFFNGSGVLQLWVSSAVPGVGVGLQRTTAGTFDSTDYNATSYNRGWITVGYIS